MIEIFFSTRKNMNRKVELSFASLGKALAALEAMVNKPMQEDRSNIDACIQRFEFAIELWWKLLKRVLFTLGEEVVYPKDVLRAAYRGKLIDDEVIWLSMLEDRNQTSHTYDEALADQIYLRIKGYFPVMQRTYNRLFSSYSTSPK